MNILKLLVKLFSRGVEMPKEREIVDKGSVCTRRVIKPSRGREVDEDILKLREK